MKIRRASDGHNLFYWCPGCDGAHHIRYNGAGRWTFNGSDTSPTFTPSVLVKTGHFVTGERPEECDVCKYVGEHPEDKKFYSCSVCHSFVTNGKIEFLADCTHALAGKKDVPVPDWPVTAEDYHID